MKTKPDWLLIAMIISVVAGLVFFVLFLDAISKL